MTQVRYTSPGVEHRARVFFCKASSVASFVLRRVFHCFPWEIAAQHGCWHIFLFCLLAGIRFVNEHTFVVLFLRSTRPLLCLLKRSPQSKKYRAERPPFFFEFWSKSEYPYSAKNSCNFAYYSVDFQYILGEYPLKVAGGRPQRLRDDFVPIFDGFWPPFGEPRGSLWGHLGARVSNLERLC